MVDVGDCDSRKVGEGLIGDLFFLSTGISNVYSVLFRVEHFSGLKSNGVTEVDLQIAILMTRRIPLMLKTIDEQLINLK